MKELDIFRKKLFNLKLMLSVGRQYEIVGRDFFYFSTKSENGNIKQLNLLDKYERDVKDLAKEMSYTYNISKDKKRIIFTKVC